MSVSLLRIDDTNIHSDYAESDYRENVEASLPGKGQDRRFSANPLLTADSMG